MQPRVLKKLPLHLLLLLFLQLAVQDAATSSAAKATSAPDSTVQEKECQSSRQEFSRSPTQLILKNLFSADVVLESRVMKDSDIELFSKQSVTVPVNCVHKGYLKSHQLTVGLHENFTRCINPQALEPMLAREAQFVFFLRRLTDGGGGATRWVMLEGGLAPAEAFNDRLQTVCSFQNATAASPQPGNERICPRPSSECRPLMTLKTAMQPWREPLWEPSAATDAAAGGSASMPNDSGHSGSGGGGGGGGGGASYARGKLGSSAVRTAAATSAAVVLPTAAMLLVARLITVT